MIKQGLEACLQSQTSTQKISCRNGTLVCNRNNNYRRCSREIQLQKNDNVTNKALLIEGDANGFMRPHLDCAMVMDSLQFNNMPRLKTVSFSNPPDNGSTANNLKLVIDYCADNDCQEAWPRSRPKTKYDNDAAYPVLLKIKSHEIFC